MLRVRLILSWCEECEYNFGTKEIIGVSVRPPGS